VNFVKNSRQPVDNYLKIGDIGYTEGEITPPGRRRQPEPPSAAA
jgi:hypothetical protein